jgi:DNA-binding MarR family transcriptional regulator
MPRTQQGLETWQAFTNAHGLLVATIERDLAAAGLPPLSWYEVLTALARADEAQLRIHALAQAVVLSPSGLSRLLDRMERAGVIRRESCKRDRRGAFAVITDEGHALLERMEPVHQQAIEQHFVPQLRDEESALQAALVRVADSARGECPADDEPGV